MYVFLWKTNLLFTISEKIVSGKLGLLKTESSPEPSRLEKARQAEESPAGCSKTLLRAEGGAHPRCGSVSTVAP